MIELCSRRRMIACIIALACVTVLVVILESWLTSETPASPISSTGSTLNSAAVATPISSGDNRSDSAGGQSGGVLYTYCWLTERYSVLTECRACSDLGAVADTLSVCSTAANTASSGVTKSQPILSVEKVLCLNSRSIAYKRCALPPKLRAFVTLHVGSLLTALLSGCVVFVRRRHLSRTALRRIQRQIAAGV